MDAAVSCRSEACYPSSRKHGRHRAVKRRAFITLLGGAAAWPFAVRAQQPTTPNVGYVHPASPQPIAGLLAAFREGLSELGYVEGQNVVIEYRWANNDLSRLPELVADLVH